MATPSRRHSTEDAQLVDRVISQLSAACCDDFSSNGYRCQRQRAAPTVSPQQTDHQRSRRRLARPLEEAAQITRTPMTDYDDKGNAVGICSASRHMARPRRR